MELPKPQSYLAEAKDCLFFSVHCKIDGTCILVSTRHKGSLLMLSEYDIQKWSQDPFLFNIPEAFLNEHAPDKYSLPIFFDENEEGAGGKIFHATVDRRSNMVKLSMEANYNDKYHGFFNARLLLPYIDFMALMTIIPKLLLHTFELQNKEFWTLSEAVTLFSVILMKSITEEQWQVFRSLVQSFPTRGSKLETSFPEKLITTLKREKYTSKYLEELTQTRKNNPMPILEAAQGIIRSLPQNRQIMLCRAVFQAYVARKVQLVGFELASSKANMKKTASLLLTDGYILVDNDEFYDLKWVNEAAPQLASKGKNLEQDQMRSENDVNSALNINVLVPNALPADNQATCDFLEDFAANAEFYDSIDDVSEEYHQKIAMSSPPAKSLKMTDADDLVPNVKTSMKDVIVVPRPPVADVSAKQNIETTANANGQKTADSRPKRLMTTSHPPRPLLQQPQPSPYRLPPPPPTASVPLQQLHLPPTHANQLMQHQQPFQCQVQVESQQQQPRQYQQQQRPIYHQPLQAQQTQQQLYHIGLPAAPQPPPSFAAHYQPFRQPAANFYPSPLYTAHCQQHGGYSPCPQTMMTPIQQSALRVPAPLNPMGTPMMWSTPMVFPAPTMGFPPFSTNPNGTSPPYGYNLY